MSHDIDPKETKEWLEAIDSVISVDGIERANYLLQVLVKEKGIELDSGLNTPYRNTISQELEQIIPGNLDLESKIRALVRWNAAAMVVRAARKNPSLGGHIGSFASSATLYDVGFNYFWNAESKDNGGDLVYVQGHVAPGIYARSFLEGRLSIDKLENFRQEVNGQGLSSYPHPWLMPDYWQFPTVSMGLGPIQAIYQARFLKYLDARGLADTKGRHVWCMCGDGEMDEPESLGAITLAGRENLDNLIFVINCNLQRLDGPVRGNGKIIQELESIFKGANWSVVKVLWGGNWDPLFENDDSGMLQKRMDEVVDGEYQNYKAKGGAYTRENFFGKYSETKKLVENLSDEDIWNLKRGGHDPQKVYAAYKWAVDNKKGPTVILAKTVKGYGLGAAGEALNTAHNTKKMADDELRAFRDRFNIPIADDKISEVPFYKPAEDSLEIQYLKERRQALGGHYPKRRVAADESVIIPDLSIFKSQLESSNDREISTTMAFVRVLTALCKDKNIGKQIVPIVPDEARTFGMEGLFRQLGIYAFDGQAYEPEDSSKVMYYKESKNGQILEEGINEAGAFCSWIAAATSYSVSNRIMIPFYIYYSMFGFQRIGDLAYAAGDSRAKGFLIGGTAGRTTLNGEGLQHQDGHSHVLAATIPNCVTYDPTYSYELAVIIHNGLERMYKNNESVFYYITTMNENYTHPKMPDDCEEGIIRGMYLLKSMESKNSKHVQLFGAGTILREVIAASLILQNEFDITSDIWSVTSFNELGRDGIECSRYNRLNPDKLAKVPYIKKCLEDKKGPIVVATDYIYQLANQVREFVDRPYYILGTDGFGRSDTREKLRDFFEVSAKHIVVAVLKALVEKGEIDTKILKQAILKYKIDSDSKNPIQR